MSATISDGRLRVLLSDITHFRAMDKYVSAFTVNGDELLLSDTIKVLEVRHSADFIRVHRAVIARRSLMQSIRKVGTTGYNIALDGVSEGVPGSRRYVRVMLKDMPHLKLSRKRPVPPGWQWSSETNTYRPA